MLQDFYATSTKGVRPLVKCFHTLASKLGGLMLDDIELLKHCRQQRPCAAVAASHLPPALPADRAARAASEANTFRHLQRKYIDRFAPGRETLRHAGKVAPTLPGEAPWQMAGPPRKVPGCVTRGLTCWTFPSSMFPPRPWMTALRICGAHFRGRGNGCSDDGAQRRQHRGP